VSDISCPDDGSCTAVGYTAYGAGKERGFVVTEKDGTWEAAVRAGPEMSSISCPAADSCAAGGSTRDGRAGHYEPVVADEHDGVWGKPIRVPGIARLTSADAHLVAISCSKEGSCAAAGYYEDRSASTHPFVVDEVNGVWGKAIAVRGLSSQISDAFDVTSLSCAAPGFCAVDISSGFGDAEFVVDEQNGVWGKAIEIPGLAALNVSGSGWLSSVSCGKPGFCAAGGSFLGDTTGEAFVANEENGIWHKAIVVPGSVALDVGGVVGTSGADLYSISCVSADSCAASGSYFDRAKKIQAFVVDERNGVWGKAVKVPGAAHLNVGGDAEATSISCSKPGYCVAGGHYYDRFNRSQAFLVTEKNWVWSNAVDVPGLKTLNVGGRKSDGGGASVSAIACAPGGRCTVGGSYTDASDRKQAFVTAP